MIQWGTRIDWCCYRNRDGGYGQMHRCDDRRYWRGYYMPMVSFERAVTDDFGNLVVLDLSDQCLRETPCA